MNDPQHKSIIAKTNYNKNKPNLRRHYPEEWGRFLDNHYDPDAHKKPFVIAMKAPDMRYRYSQQVGLSYKFSNAKVLEKVDVENYNQEKFKFIRYEEFNQIKDGQVIISIEHCINCHNHQVSTKHDESKYHAFANHIQASVREQFPQVLVIVKPISTDQDEKVKHLRTEKDTDKPTLIDPQLKPSRIGAFEVQLFSKNEGRFLEKILHSKLKTGLWPSISMILEKVHFFLPRVPKVTIQLFRDNHAHIQDDNEDQVSKDEFKDFQVTVKSTYNATTSQHQLNEFLVQSQQEKLTQQLMARHKRLLVQNKTSRPTSAKTLIGGPDSLQQLSLFKTQNQQYQQHFQSYTSLPKVRPISASTYQPSQRSFDNIHKVGASLQQSAYGQMRTIQQQTAQGQQTLLDGGKQLRPISAFTSSSKLSKATRPMPAQTRKSAKQRQEHSLRKGRGLGYFGDDNDKQRELEERQKNEQNYKVQSQEKKTDDSGRIILQHLPIGYYCIEVKGTDIYQSSYKELNITNEEDKDEITIFVGVKPRIDTDIEFSFLYENISGGNKHEQIRPEIVEARAVLLPKVLKSDESTDIDDMVDEEYEFEILWDARKQVWVTTLKGGKYLINVKAKGFKEFNKSIDLDRRDYQFVMTPINKDIKHVHMQAVNIQTGQPIKNTFFEFYKEVNQLPEEGLSDENGLFAFGVRQVGIQHIIARKAGFITVEKKINFTNGFMHKNEQSVITIPMMREESPDSTMAYAVLTYNGNLRNIQLKALIADDKIDVHAHMENLQVAQIDMSKMFNYNVNEESPEKKDSNSNNPSVRFICKIDEQPELLQLNPEYLDRNFKNVLQDSNMQFTIIYRDHLNGNNYQMRTLEAPSFIDGNVWDICFFCSPYIIEANYITTREPRAIEFFSYYQKLSVFFRNRRQQKFNQTLGIIFEVFIQFIGFDAHGVYRMDDTWIDERKLVDYLQNLLGDKLLSHDQKKMIQKVNLRKEPEEKLTAINQELQEFYVHFARIFKNLFGYISYKNLQEYIERL